MMNPTNSTAGHERRDGDPSPSLAHATPYVCHPESPRFLWGEGSAFGSYAGIRVRPRLLDSDLSYRKQKTSNFLIDNFGATLLPCSLASLPPCLLAFCISNRPAPRLESSVSHRKQRVGCNSNRPKNAVCNNRLLSASIPNFQLPTSNFQLRASHV